MDIKKINVIRIIKNLLIFIFIFIICFSNIFPKPVNDLDEIWNYNFARNIADGLVPYKDFNMVVTPLLYFFCGMIINIFGNQLIVMRVLATLLMTMIFFMVFLILKKITTSQIAIISVIVFLCAFKDIMCIDYNYAVLFIALILTYIEIRNKEKSIFEYSKKDDFIIGLIAGISILFKQTTGIALTTACIGYKILAVRNKENFREFFKIALIRFLGAVIPTIIFIVYLIINNAFLDFVDYTILGLKTFTNSISYMDFMKKNFQSAIFVPVFLLIMFINIFNKKNKKEDYILFAFAISSFIVAFPITDKIHFLIGSLITYVASIYFIYIIIKNHITNKRKKVLYALGNFIGTFAILSFLLYSCNIINNKYIKVPKENTLSHFYGIPENKSLKQRIFQLDEYIISQSKVGKNVFILDAEAAIYNIPLNIYYKDYDMFNMGNFGSKGEDGIIERIKNEENCVYLLKDNHVNWQSPKKVREYIKNNLELKGKISIYNIYERK